MTKIGDRATYRKHLRLALRHVGGACHWAESCGVWSDAEDLRALYGHLKAFELQTREDGDVDPQQLRVGVRSYLC